MKRVNMVDRGSRIQFPIAYFSALQGKQTAEAIQRCRCPRCQKDTLLISSLSSSWRCTTCMLQGGIEDFWTIMSPHLDPLSQPQNPMTTGDVIFSYAHEATHHPFQPDPDWQRAMEQFAARLARIKAPLPEWATTLIDTSHMLSSQIFVNPERAVLATQPPVVVNPGVLALAVHPLSGICSAEIWEQPSPEHPVRRSVIRGSAPMLFLSAPYDLETRPVLIQMPSPFAALKHTISAPFAQTVAWFGPEADLQTRLAIVQSLGFVALVPSERDDKALQDVYDALFVHAMHIALNRFGLSLEHVSENRWLARPASPDSFSSKEESSRKRFVAVLI